MDEKNPQPDAPVSKPGPDTDGAEPVPDNQPPLFDTRTLGADVVLRPSIPPRADLVPVPLAQLPGPLDRERPKRGWLVPKPVLITLGAVLGSLMLAALVFAAFFNAPEVPVPDVVGLGQVRADALLDSIGLGSTIAERRFSARPAGEVLAQSPAPGTLVRRGRRVSLIISAGTEEVVVPDVVGKAEVTARKILESKGLQVVVELVASESASTTVLSTVPAAGSRIKTGDTVRLLVASPLERRDALRAYSLEGLRVVIDPAPTSEPSDIPLSVARRLYSLLEASGAKVTLTRSQSTSTTASVRSSTAAAFNPAIAIGLSISPGVAGRRMTHPASVGTTATALAESLAVQATQRLSQSAPPVQPTGVGTDEVFGALPSPWVRLTLGSLEDTSDKAAFADPNWADSVARALYTSIGEALNTKAVP